MKNSALTYFAALLAVLLMQGDYAAAQRSSHSHSSSHSYYSGSHSKSYSSGRHRKNYNYGVSRDKHGRIKRSSKATYDFRKQTGYPHGRKGYVIDHIIPLSKGGCDCPSNMQWQTKEEAKRKDKTERK